ncbi:MAG: hypothetical protein ACI4TJ_01090 [Candidatus Cryptobacteroides sp.]
MKRKGNIFITFAAALLGLLLSGCNIWSDENLLSELTISVTVSNTPDAPIARATLDPSDYVGAMHPGEKMQTLRIVIVRPDGTVEHNRFLDFYSAGGASYTNVENISFRVLGPETKKVYLFVNEAATRINQVTGQSERIVKFDFDGIAQGSIFPETDLAELQITLNSSDDELLYEELPSAALPMSECHEVQMPSSDYHTDLYVTRAAVKFSFLIQNDTGLEHNLEALTISKGSNIEYYLPRIEYTGNPYQGTFNVADYTVPNTDLSNYYVFRKDFDRQITTTGDKGDGVTSLEPIYLLEGKYDEDGNDLNYSMSMTFDGKEYSDHFPNVSTLPRNTHVVVLVKIGQYGLDWTVDVRPYQEIILNPGFGQ